jgi:hypothetical protein
MSLRPQLGLPPRSQQLPVASSPPLRSRRYLTTLPLRQSSHQSKRRPHCKIPLLSADTTKHQDALILYADNLHPSHSKIAPAKRKQKSDDDDSDTIYAADVDLDSTTYQGYKPKPTRSRGKLPPAPSPATKRKFQSMPRGPPAAHQSQSESGEDTVHVRSNIRQLVSQIEEEDDPEDSPQVPGNSRQRIGQDQHPGT